MIFLSESTQPLQTAKGSKCLCDINPAAQTMCSKLVQNHLCIRMLSTARPAHRAALTFLQLKSLKSGSTASPLPLNEWAVMRLWKCSYANLLWFLKLTYADEKDRMKQHSTDLCIMKGVMENCRKVEGLLLWVLACLPSDCCIYYIIDVLICNST